MHLYDGFTVIHIIKLYKLQHMSTQLYSNLQKAQSHALGLFGGKDDQRKTSAQPKKQNKGAKKIMTQADRDAQIDLLMKQDQQPLQEEIANKLQYQPGLFSKFAYKQETQVIKTKQFVTKVISEAIQSHVKRLDFIANVDTQLEVKAQTWQTLFKSEFNLPQLLIQFIKNPLQAQLAEIQSSSTNSQLSKSSVKDKIQKFVRRIIDLRQYAVVENRIVHLRDFKMSEYIKDEYDNIYVPSNFHQRFYLQVSGSKLSHAYFQKDKMFSRQQMMDLSKKQRQTIVEMVFRFLKDKGIVIEKLDIFDQISDLIKNK